MKPKVRDDVVFRRLGDDFAVLDPRAHQVHILNPPCAAVWVMCDGRHALPEIAAELSRAFELQGAPSILDNVEEAVASFREKGLLA